MSVPIAGWRCRWCRSEDGDVVLDLGEQPAADYFPAPDDATPDPVYPLRMVHCRQCHLAQLEEDPTSADEPRGVEPAALVAQARAAVGDLVAAGLASPGCRVAEEPSPHGGSWLPLLDAAGLDVVAPGDDGKVGLLVDSLGMMHEPDQRAAIERRAALLDDDGVLAMHVHPLATIMRDGTWNALRHGHYAYYSVPVLVAMARATGLVPVGAWEYSLYGGTVLVAFAPEGAREPVQGEPRRILERVLREERDDGVLDADVVTGLQTSLTESVGALRGWLAEQGGRRVAAYGAASRAVAVLQIAGVTPADLVAVADASPAKQGRTMPGTRVPIVAPQDLVDLAPELVLLFVPDLLDEVRAALPQIEASGGRWVVAEPLLHEVVPLV